MNSNYITAKIRQISLRRFFYPFGILIVTGILLYQIPFYDVINPIFVEEPLKILDLYNEETIFVELYADTLYYTGYDYVENGKAIGSYYYNLYDGTCIFYLLSESLCDKKPEVLNNIHMKGKLESGGKLLTDLIKKMAEDLSWTAQGLSQVSSHIIVNELEYLLGKTIFFFAVDIILFIISAIWSLYLFLYILYPYASPICLNLRRYGSITGQIQELEEELRSQMQVRCGDFMITKHYLLVWSKHQLKILPLNQIIWIYKYSNLHYFRLRKMKITYTLRIIGRKSTKIIVPFQKKEDVDQVTEYISTYDSTILIGYSKENEKIAKGRR